MEYIPRLKELYKKKIINEMTNRFNYKNHLQVPKLEKIVVNIGLKEAKDDIKVIDVATAELASMTGQKPQIRRAKKSISNFKLRQGVPIGLKVTLRDSRMYEFFDRFVSCAIPRIRDFRGLNTKGFDGNGNYNLGLQEQYIFPEIDLDKSDRPRGMNISFVTSAKTDEEAKGLLTLLGMPFKKEK
ncbi:MAG: 50S ribosomal protein L5 [Elusimicrobia bacterium CG1_02_37_114]|nr:MAG: 50S ribosomal protein L5 [Elusimicrobia bacterium CG1_02_37_114]